MGLWGNIVNFAKNVFGIERKPQQTSGARKKIVEEDTDFQNEQIKIERNKEAERLKYNLSEEEPLVPNEPLMPHTEVSRQLKQEQQIEEKFVKRLNDRKKRGIEITAKDKEQIIESLTKGDIKETRTFESSSDLNSNVVEAYEEMLKDNFTKEELIDIILKKKDLQDYIIKSDLLADNMRAVIIITGTETIKMKGNMPNQYFQKEIIIQGLSPKKSAEKGIFELTNQDFTGQELYSKLSEFGLILGESPFHISGEYRIENIKIKYDLAKWVILN